MKISLQRQCDGVHPDLGEPTRTCEARVHLELELPDHVPTPEWNEAWDSALAALGWRRVGGPAEEIRRVGTTERLYVVPDAKTWVVCPEHAKGMVCNRCGFKACSCMGGPRFDVRVGDGDDE